MIPGRYSGVVTFEEKNKNFAVFLYLSHNNFTPLVPLGGFPVKPYSPVSSLPFSFACLPTLRVEFLKSWLLSPLTRSVFVGEVSQVKGFLLLPYSWSKDFQTMTRCIRYPVSKFPGQLVHFYLQTLAGKCRLLCLLSFRNSNFHYDSDWYSYQITRLYVCIVPYGTY